MQNGAGVLPPAPPQPVPVSGIDSPSSLANAWKHELLPAVPLFSYPEGMRCTVLLRALWYNFRLATYDYKAAIQDVYEPGTGRDIHVYVLLEQIHPMKIPGYTTSEFFGQMYPRSEWGRRNWYSLSYGQDMNAIAALTGPVARFLGPQGYRAEEVLVRVKNVAILNQYSFKRWKRGGVMAAEEIPNDPILLVFKVTHLTDPNRVYALAPTGPRFGWNWFARSWRDFEADYMDELLRIRPLGTTRKVLDDQVIDDAHVDPRVLTLPARAIRKRQRRDARLMLRNVLNRYGLIKDCRLNPEQLVGMLSYGDIAEFVHRQMTREVNYWVQDFCVERADRRKAALKLAFQKPWHSEKLWQFRVVPGFTLPEQPGNGQNKRMDSASNPNDGNEPTAENPAEPATSLLAPPAAAAAAAAAAADTNSRPAPKLKILENFNFKGFKPRTWGFRRGRQYQSISEGPAGPQDQPLSSQPVPDQQGQQSQQSQQAQQHQQVQQSTVIGEPTVFDCYGVTGGLLDADPPPLPPEPVPGQHPLAQVTTNETLDMEAVAENFRRRYLEAQRDLQAWYSTHGDSQYAPDPRWGVLPPRRPTIHAPVEVQEPSPENNVFQFDFWNDSEGVNDEDSNENNDDEDAITPAPPPPPPPPKDYYTAAAQDAEDYANEMPERALWANTRFQSWDPYMRHWYWYEISDEYRDLTEKGIVGPQTMYVDRDRLLYIDLQPPG